MPFIKITEEDRSGLVSGGNETIVFVPGTIALDDSSNPVELDDNGCYLIVPASGNDILANVPEKLKKNDYITAIVGAGLQVLYKNPGDSSSLDFLLDKNSYNIRFLTAGGEKMFEDDSDSSAYNTSTALPLLKIASKRGDCAVIGAISCNKNADENLEEIKSKLDNTILGDSSSEDLGTYMALFCSNMVVNDSSDDSSLISPYAINTYPDIAYLKAYSKAIKGNNTWESLANSARGTVDSFSTSKTISKYELDNIMDDLEGGRTFNGIIKLRPSNEAVIWGDRTLRKNDVVTINNEAVLNLKATSFLSVRNIIIDISKRAYNTAVKYTFETNNDVTWSNFKNNITTLLDEMVADYKLADYRIIKLPSDNRAEIKCEIHISPYGPVEDFDINIVINNTDVETTVE